MDDRYRMFVGGCLEAEFSKLPKAREAALDRAMRLAEYSGNPEVVKIRDFDGKLIGEAHAAVKATWKQHKRSPSTTSTTPSSG